MLVFLLMKTYSPVEHRVEITTVTISTGPTTNCQTPRKHQRTLPGPRTPFEGICTDNMTYLNSVNRDDREKNPSRPLEGAKTNAA